MATEKVKVAKGELAGLAEKLLKGGETQFQVFKVQAIELGSTESSARQTWQRIKNKLGLSNVKAKTTAVKAHATATTETPTPKPKDSGKQRAPKSGVPVLAPTSAPKAVPSGSDLRDDELASLLQDGLKYRALKAGLNA